MGRFGLLNVRDAGGRPRLRRGAAPPRHHRGALAVAAARPAAGPGAGRAARGDASISLSPSAGCSRSECRPARCAACPTNISTAWRRAAAILGDDTKDKHAQRLGPGLGREGARRRTSTSWSCSTRRCSDDGSRGAASWPRPAAGSRPCASGSAASRCSPATRPGPAWQTARGAARTPTACPARRSISASPTGSAIRSSRANMPKHEEQARSVGYGATDGDGNWRPLAAGEFLLGWPDEAQEIPGGAMPLDFSRNGTFFAYRKLHQDIDGFKAWVDERRGTAPAGLEAGELRRGAAQTLMAKMAGRWSDGVPLDVAPDLWRLAGVQPAHAAPDVGPQRPRRQRARRRPWSISAIARIRTAPMPARLPYPPRATPATCSIRAATAASRNRGWARRSTTAAGSCAAACPTAAPDAADGEHGVDHAGRLRQPSAPVRVRPAAMDELRPRRQRRQRHLPVDRQS